MPTNLLVETPTDPLLPTRAAAPRPPTAPDPLLPSGLSIQDRTTALEIELGKMRRRVQLGSAVIGGLGGALIVCVFFLLRPDHDGRPVEAEVRNSPIVAVGNVGAPSGAPPPPRAQVTTAEPKDPNPEPPATDEAGASATPHPPRARRAAPPHPVEPPKPAGSAALSPGAEIRAATARYERGELSFSTLLSRVKAAASEAPPERQKSAKLYLNQAEFSSDLNKLKQGIDILFPP
jgi:hypothetical protein